MASILVVPGLQLRNESPASDELDADFVVSTCFLRGGEACAELY